MAVYNETNKAKWTKDGRHWYFVVYYKDFNGNTKQKWSKMYSSKTEAKEAESLFILKRDNPINKPFKLIANECINELYKIRKESTVYAYEKAFKKNIEPYFNNFYINEISIATINHWKNTMEKQNFKIRYLNKLYNILKIIFDYAIKHYGLDQNVVSIAGNFQSKNEEIIKDDEKLRYLTYEDFEKFISNIEDITWKTFFMFLYYTGMRKGEVQALSWKDIDFENKYIIVNKTLSVKTKDLFKITSTKNNINRKIKISKKLEQQLLEYKKHMKTYVDFNEKWFVFGGSRFMPQTTIDRKKHYYFNLCEIDEITIHEFRHSHVSLLINEYIKTSKEKNMKIDTAKFFLMMSSRMGHTIAVMQKTYMHLFPSIQDEIVDLLDNL